MQKMFHSATLKLTAWYLGIIMTISLLFSFAIYQLNFHEINIRLENFQNELIGVDSSPIMGGITNLRQAQTDQAALQMIMSLFYINVVILVGGGIGSYWLARRTLRPIEEVHEAQSRFTSDASHELRTPLAVMKAEIEVALRNKNLDTDETRELLESNLEEVDKLIQLSEMLLNLSKLDYDKLKYEKLNLSGLLNSTLKSSFKDSAKRFDITSRKDAVVQADKAAINELMIILIDNALKYSEPDSKITIRIFQRVRTIGFKITNAGPTIDEKVLPHLFERFYRGDTSRTNSTENGYGLGLAIAKKIVDVHNGEIHATSRSHKTSFTFYLPITKVTKAS